jgi:hypothetical protein
LLNIKKIVDVIAGAGIARKRPDTMYRADYTGFKIIF